MNAIGNIINKSKLFVCEGGGYEAIGQNGYIQDFLSNGDGNVYVGNAFSLQMVDETAIVSVQSVDANEIPETAISCIGHPDTANVVSSLLGRHVEYNRTSIHLNNGDVLYVAQIIGGRLPEGTITLPDGCRIEFRKIVVRS